MKPDIIVFASGDADFVPLMHEVRKAGVRVEVAAFEETAGIDLQLTCSGFINVAVYYASSLATQNGEHDQQEPMKKPSTERIQAQEHGVEEDSIQSAQVDDEIPVSASIPAPVSENTDMMDALESIDELTL